MVILAFVSRMAGPSKAIFEWRCEHLLQKVEIAVDIKPVAFTVDTGYSMAQLTKQFPPDAAAVVLGITEANLYKNITLINPGFVQPETGRVCVRPKLKVSLSFQPMTVYIAGNFPKKTCKYDEIFAHEMRHVKAYQEFLPTIGQNVVQQLHTAIGDGVYYFSGEDEARASFEKTITSMLMPFLNKQLEQVEKTQRGIDTPEEYDRLSNVCLDAA